MKELSIEEKAKRYDEAVERANSLINCNQLGDAWIYRLLPELQENSDERIVKDIIAYMRYERKSTEEEIENRFIPWLEKQGKVIDEYEDKLDRCACESFDKGYKAALEKQKEQKPVGQKATWSEEDENILEDAITAVDLMMTSEFQKTHPNLYKSFEVSKRWLKSIKERIQPQLMK